MTELHTEKSPKDQLQKNLGTEAQIVENLSNWQHLETPLAPLSSKQLDLLDHFCESNTQQPSSSHETSPNSDIGTIEKFAHWFEQVESRISKPPNSSSSMNDGKIEDLMSVVDTNVKDLEAFRGIYTKGMEGTAILQTSVDACLSQIFLLKKTKSQLEGKLAPYKRFHSLASRLPYGIPKTVVERVLFLREISDSMKELEESPGRLSEVYQFRFKMMLEHQLFKATDDLLKEFDDISTLSKDFQLIYHLSKGLSGDDVAQDFLGKQKMKEESKGLFDDVLTPLNSARNSHILDALDLEEQCNPIEKLPNLKSPNQESNSKSSSLIEEENLNIKRMKESKAHTVGSEANFLYLESQTESHLLDSERKVHHPETNKNQKVPEVKDEQSGKMWVWKFQYFLEHVEHNLDIPSYKTTHHELQKWYFNRRTPEARAYLERCLEELRQTLKHSSLFCSAIYSLVNFCRQEVAAYAHLFTKYSIQLQEHLSGLSQVLYDFLRPLIVKNESRDSLMDLCLNIKALLGSFKGDTYPEVEGVITQLLKDCQERLIYRTSVTLTGYLDYEPCSGDLAYPEKLEVVPLEKNLPDMWYPAVRRCLVLLVQLGKCLDGGILRDILDEALGMTLVSLGRAGRLISRKKGKIHGCLFSLKHLLVLKEQLDALGLLGVNQPGRPRFIINEELKVAYHDFVDVHSRKVVGGALYYVKKNLAKDEGRKCYVVNIISNLRRNFTWEFGRMCRYVSLYLEDEGTKDLLVTAVKRKILEGCARLEKYLESQFSKEEFKEINCPKEEEVNLVLSTIILKDLHCLG